MRKHALIGKFVTARLAKKEEDCRQGWVTSESPLKIKGQSGKEYLCKGIPIMVINPPKQLLQPGN